LSSAIVDKVFANPGRHTSLELLVGVYGYAVQIYADFSGYTDIAIGIALLLGIRFPQNFDRPYAAESIQEFWRCWHMTLSRWLRDFLYIPLGGNRGGRDARDRNLFLTMLLGGLWHGAAWTFVVWGAYQGAGLVVERRLAERRELAEARDRRRRLVLVSMEAEAAGDAGGLATLADELEPAPATRRPLSERQRRWLGRLVTFHFVCIGWVFFRAESVSVALQILWRMVFAWGPAPLVTGPVLLTIAASLAVQFVPRTLTKNLMADISRLSPLVQAVGFGAFLVLVDLLGPPGIAPFIYFQF
jgi:D-alanyl-lipoteichoic acid acyltransferase DltB (MBOAT superfamily)